MAQQSVTLNPGESKVVSFEATPTVAKVYQVSVDGLSGSFTAAAVPYPPFYDAQQAAIDAEIDAYVSAALKKLMDEAPENYQYEAPPIIASIIGRGGSLILYRKWDGHVADNSPYDLRQTIVNCWYNGFFATGRLEAAIPSAYSAQMAELIRRNPSPDLAVYFEWLVETGFIRDGQSPPQLPMGVPGSMTYFLNNLTEEWGYKLVVAGEAWPVSIIEDFDELSRGY